MDISIAATNKTGIIDILIRTQQFDTLSHKLDKITHTITNMNAKINLVKCNVI